MNHDYAHCADYKRGKCPVECFRGQLVRDLNKCRPGMEVSWMNLEGSKECLLVRNTP